MDTSMILQKGAKVLKSFVSLPLLQKNHYQIKMHLDETLLLIKMFWLQHANLPTPFKLDYIKNRIVVNIF